LPVQSLPMWKRILLIGSCSLAAAHASSRPEITETEFKWLKAGAPVLTYAKEQKLPVDIVVQPQATAGEAPLAMGYVDGRCKLVLSMRGNAQAESALADVSPSLAPIVIEAMVAHELGHCWRYVQGAWHTLPAGFVDAADDERDDKELAEKRREMRDTRREEGLADLIGLAWTLKRHPELYAQVHAWLEKIRADQPVPGSHHDTRVWVRLAKDHSAFPAASTPFEQAWAVWQRGLRSDGQ
jgi:hypothetical protein